MGKKIYYFNIDSELLREGGKDFIVFPAKFSNDAIPVLIDEKHVYVKNENFYVKVNAPIEEA